MQHEAAWRLPPQGDAEGPQNLHLLHSIASQRPTYTPTSLSHSWHTSGRPGEFHPGAPTERSVTVSRHSALLILSTGTRASRPGGRRARVPSVSTCSTRLLPGQRLVARAKQITDEPAPSLRFHYRSFSATTSRSASVSASVLNASQFLLLDALPLATHHPFWAADRRIGTRLPTFRVAAADQAQTSGSRVGLTVEIHAGVTW